MALDVFTPQGCFGSSITQFRIGNTYARPLGPLFRSVFPGTALPDYNCPYLVAGDFNIHNPAADSFRIFSSIEERESVPYLTLGSDRGFSLVNTPGISTRFPYTSSHKPSAIARAFANPLIFPAFRLWDASFLLLTGSDHVPIRRSHAPPDPDSSQPGKWWQEADLPAINNPLTGWHVPSPPLLP